MVSLLRITQKDGNSTNCFTGINFVPRIWASFQRKRCWDRNWCVLDPVYNDLQHLQERSRSNRWWLGCKLLFLPCLHSGKVVGELFQLGQRAANGFCFPSRVYDPVESILFPSHAVMQNDAVLSPVWNQKVTSSFTLSVFGSLDTQLHCDAIFQSRILLLKKKKVEEKKQLHK